MTGFRLPGFHAYDLFKETRLGCDLAAILIAQDLCFSAQLSALGLVSKS